MTSAVDLSAACICSGTVSLPQASSTILTDTALLAHSDTDTPLFRTGAGVLTVADLHCRTAQLAALLADRTEQRWALYADNSFDFLAAFLALLHTGKQIVLPASRQSLADIGGSAEAVLTDPPLPTLTCPVISLSLPQSVTTPAFGIPRPGATVSLLTSGSTGAPKLVRKELSQLEAEVRALETLWGERLAGCSVLASVSHQHIYGLLFKLLWPLCTGRLIFEEPLFFPERLERALDLIDAPCVLVSSPAQLRRLPDGFDFSLLGRAARMIFSSGGPLPAEAAARIHQLSGVLPTEVLGSTETGGIAWRQQHTDGEPWRLLPEVAIDIRGDEGALFVRSPFAAPAACNWVATGDLVAAVGDGAFVHHGRKDRIVKLEERRLSLPELEARLRSHPFVEDAACLLLDAERHPRGRRVLGAALVLSSEGEAAHREIGRIRFTQAIRRNLLEHFDAVCLPRVFRFPKELPCDAQGKCSRAALSRLFDSESRQPRLPIVLRTEAQENGQRWELRIPADLRYFAGHFPGAPLVPGFVQLEWVCHFITMSAPSARPSRFEALKFSGPLLPNQRVSLILHWAPDTGRAAFEFTSETGERLASGRIWFNSSGEQCTDAQGAGGGELTCFPKE